MDAENDLAWTHGSLPLVGVLYPVLRPVKSRSEGQASVDFFDLVPLVFSSVRVC